MAITVSACGGGSGAASGITPPGVVSISSFTPSSGSAGTEILVSGNGFNTVTAARLGASPGLFIADSATRLRLIVPVGAQTGRIEVVAPGAAALSASQFTVTGGAPIPAALSVTPEDVLEGGRFAVAGENLDRVVQAKLGAQGLAIVSRSATSLILEVPAGTSGNYLTLLDSQGIARQSVHLITVLEAMRLTNWSRAVIARGQLLTLEGEHLDRANTVRFGGTAAVAVQSRIGSHALTVRVPDFAQSGPVTVVANVADTATSTAPLSVVDPVLVTPANISAAPGAPIIVTGSGLDSVSAVTVGTPTATINSRNATQIVFTPPGGVNCAPVTLLSLSQDPVDAGSVVIGGGCAMRAAGVDFAQLLSRPGTDVFLPLVPAKESWLRAYVVSDYAGIPAPPMRAVGYLGGIPVGSVGLAGPATLPVLSAWSALPASFRDDDTVTYNAELPTAWIANGLRIQIEIDPTPPTGNALNVDNAVPMGTEANIDLVLVPLISGGNVPILPTVAEVLEELVRRLPVAQGRIQVSQRAPYTLTSVGGGVTTQAHWSAALAELESLRAQEAPTAQYYGMVRPISVTGITGIGYVNALASVAANLSALGVDSSHANWRRTMIHEFGHNYSRRHAPCGNPDNPDPDYPYPGGVLGSTPLFDSLANRVMSSFGHTDVMGYCNGSWFSDYNLREMQRFLEARALSSAATTGAAPASLLVVSGIIHGGDVQFAPVRVVRGHGRTSNGGRHVLRVHTRGGAVIEKFFTTAEVDHSRSDGHFRVDLADPGEIASIEVLHEGRPLPVSGISAGPRLPARFAIGMPTEGPWAKATHRGDQLDVTWNVTATPYATLTLVEAGRRQILALNASGGKLSLPLAASQTGRLLEASLSDGLNARLVTITLP
ncbi:MAG: IPT/TIG domain-containing protein [Burkholderiales bacterium]